MTKHDKTYFKEMFKMGQVLRVWLVEAPLTRDRWEMTFDFKNGEQLFAETRRGEPKRFASIEAATRYAHDIGFRGMQITWGDDL